MLEELMQYGLSEKEAQTYISCLEIGKATANRIAELINMPRSTTYDILERLKSLGLITTIVIDNKTNFIASNPEILLTHLDEKKQQVKNILSELKEIHSKVGDRPIAEVFQGKIAVIKLLDEILDNAKSFRVIGSQENSLEKIGYRYDKFTQKRKENNIKINQLIELNKGQKLKNDSLTETRYMSSLKNTTEAIIIFDDYVYHIIFQYEISAIKIKSKDHAQTMKIMFDELWEKAKK